MQAKELHCNAGLTTDDSLPMPFALPTGRQGFRHRNGCAGIAVFYAGTLCQLVPHRQLEQVWVNDIAILLCITNDASRRSG